LIQSSAHESDPIKLTTAIGCISVGSAILWHIAFAIIRILATVVTYGMSRTGQSGAIAVIIACVTMIVAVFRGRTKVLPSARVVITAAI
jgi:hypothetical protein